MKDFQLNSMCSFFFPTQGPNKAHTLLQPDWIRGGLLWPGIICAGSLQSHGDRCRFLLPQGKQGFSLIWCSKDSLGFCIPWGTWDFFSVNFFLFYFCLGVSFGSWWWTGRPGMLRFMGSQRVGHNWATELNWTPSEVSWSTPLSGEASLSTQCRLWLPWHPAFIHMLYLCPGL